MRTWADEAAADYAHINCEEVNDSDCSNIKCAHKTYYHAIWKSYDSNNNMKEFMNIPLIILLGDIILIIWVWCAALSLDLSLGGVRKVSFYLEVISVIRNRADHKPDGLSDVMERKTTGGERNNRTHSSRAREFNIFRSRIYADLRIRLTDVFNQI
jgi:hypothetical protein